jgi:hypothetical protein
MICTILVGGAACVINRKVPRMVLVGWFALATGILVYITCMLGVFYLDRYALPLLITIVFELLASLASFWQQGAELITKPLSDLGESYVAGSRSAGGRARSILPPHHVVLARREQLLPDLPAAIQRSNHLRGQRSGQASKAFLR